MLTINDVSKNNIYMSTLQASAREIGLFTAITFGITGYYTAMIAAPVSVVGGAISGAIAGGTSAAILHPDPYRNRVPDVIAQTKVEDFANTNLKIVNMSHNQRRIRTYSFKCGD